MHHSKFTFVTDLETSGSCPINNGIISFVMIVIDENYNIVDEFQYRVRPPFLSVSNWSKGAEEKHKITYEEVLTYPSNRQFCYDFLCWIKKYKNKYNFPLPFVCHANRKRAYIPDRKEFIEPWFDYTFLQWAMIKENYEYSFYKVFNHQNLISTLEMAREKGFKGNSLDKWAKKLNLPLKHHDAYEDTFVTVNLYEYLKKYETGNNDENKKRNTKKRNNNNFSLQF